VLVELLSGRVFVARLIRQDVAETVITDVVRMHECGVWERFVKGDIGEHERNGYSPITPSGSAEVAGVERSLPTQVVIGCIPWPGDLAALRAASGGEP